uniref:Uncharacterized protein n=1 Tax=Hyaloperonospora arabidopsidis (strain Emoy2) TaxID=559515 RepID=M4BCB7_HYAAE
MPLELVPPRPMFGYSASCAMNSRGSLGVGDEPYTPTPIGGKRVGVKAELRRDAQKRQRRTGNLAEGVPQTPMSFQTQGIHATSPDTGIDLCDDAASEASPHGTESPLARRATQEWVDVSAQAHQDLVSEVLRLRESFPHGVQTALDQSVTERKNSESTLTKYNALMNSHRLRWLSCVSR